MVSSTHPPVNQLEYPTSTPTPLTRPSPRRKSTRTPHPYTSSLTRPSHTSAISPERSREAFSTPAGGGIVVVVVVVVVVSEGFQWCASHGVAVERMGSIAVFLDFSGSSFGGSVVTGRNVFSRHSSPPTRSPLS